MTEIFLASKTNTLKTGIFQSAFFLLRYSQDWAGTFGEEARN
jgi:hypothetical protein